MLNSHSTIDVKHKIPNNINELQLSLLSTLLSSTAPSPYKRKAQVNHLGFSAD